MEGIKLGDNVKDSITGMEGVVIGLAQYLHDSDSVWVQPKSLKDGTAAESKWLPIARVEKL